MTKVISGTEMRDRLLQKIEKNTAYGKLIQDLPIRFQRCENNYGWKTDVDPRQYFAIKDWCILNFEIDDWYSGLYYVWLKNEQMVTLFSLRWS